MLRRPSLTPAPLPSGRGGLIIAETRTWIGTPYRHQASLKAVGCDCLGLLRGVWRAVMGAEPETPGPYSADWGGRRRRAAHRSGAAASHGGAGARVRARRRAPLPLPRASPGEALRHRGVARDDGARPVAGADDVVSSSAWPRSTAALGTIFRRRRCLREFEKVSSGRSPLPEGRSGLGRSIKQRERRGWARWP